MFLIRSMFWLGVIVMLLPTDTQKQEKLMKTASHVVEQTVTFCERNRTICAHASASWEIFKVKAAYGARLAQNAIVDHVLADKPANASSPAASPPRLERSSEGALITGTLRSTDLTPNWRGSQQQR